MLGAIIIFTSKTTRREYFTGTIPPTPRLETGTKIAADLIEVYQTDGVIKSQGDNTIMNPMSDVI